MGIYQLTGCLQNYVWGGIDYIPQLFGLDKKQGEHYAEWWLGTHSFAPSMIKVENQTISLTEFISQRPDILGEKNLRAFGKELPFLLKILDVEKPLSIQLHPTKQQAERGFALENEKGIDLKSPQRTYKDRNHKPEMMIALSEFWLLHGFKTKSAIIYTLKQRPSLQALATQLANQDLHTFYGGIMQANQSQLANWLLPIIEQNQAAYLANQLSLENPDYWLLYAIEAMEISLDKLDSGLLCFYLFNIVKVEKGEGIYQAAGVPHAYLRGQNIELMACSDNVVRGGLTPKHVDIAALLDIIECKEVTPEIIAVAPETESVFTYSTPAQDFALMQVKYKVQQSHSLTSQSAQILLVMAGTLTLSHENHSLTLQQGESAFIEQGVNYELAGVSEGYAVVAKLP
ncbi:mannose-6-phosphate isomerase, class I [[Haemophilus] felis]|uniref:mannose-6-phosphate isomerase n=1 Tax=[Haemophilus] felis TaxID=123822 RepID=A0A1T0B810_9PAST|nr:mannose-6-phosphate isomerase, class I [[Haemophilus] felis]NBI40775.1 mannose-6-phosphate isomerase, class I [[Haemophilus] felis]OOS06132.1 mannose-6-phosphate isomerase, class I [[Haemophilus] felis]